MARRPHALRRAEGQRHRQGRPAHRGRRDDRREDRRPARPALVIARLLIVRRKNHEQQPFGQDGPADRRPGRRHLPVQAVLRRRWRAPTAHPRDSRHLRPRQRSRAGPGAGPAVGPDAVRAGPQRAVAGPPGDRLRQGEPPSHHARGHRVDRPGCAEPGHRGRARDSEPAARAAAARRHLRHPPAGPGAAAAAAPGRGRRHGQRRVPAGLAVLRPDQPARAAAHGTPRTRCGC